MKIQKKISKKFFLKEYKKGSLFLLEKYLDKCPDNWIDCVTFIATQGIDQQKDSFLVILNDNETERLFMITVKEEIKIFIIPNNGTPIWNVILKKEQIDGAKEWTKLFIGGECLREFCDKKNIFYKSALLESGELISASNMLYLKNPGDDCRKPSCKIKESEK